MGYTFAWPEPVHITIPGQGDFTGVGLRILSEGEETIAAFQAVNLRAANIPSISIIDERLATVPKEVVNDELTGVPDPATFTFDPTPVEEGPAGTFAFTVQFCNSGHKRLTGLKSVTTMLTGGNALRNRDLVHVQATSCVRCSTWSQPK
jgi:hypothetical protein